MYCSFGDPLNTKHLKEYWRPVIAIVFVLKVTDPVCKFVAKTQPLFFDKNYESLNGSVIWVKQEHGK